MNHTNLQSSAMAEFDCAPQSYGSKRESRGRRNRREQVVSTTQRFEKMLDENPGIDRDTAMRLIVGILGIWFPWISLLMPLFIYLWDVTHATQNIYTFPGVGR